MKERLQQLLQDKKLSANKLAEMLGIQPSGISHILAGRNKPSIDFVTRGQAPCVAHNRPPNHHLPPRQPNRQPRRATSPRIPSYLPSTRPIRPLKPM